MPHPAAQIELRACAVCSRSFGLDLEARGRPQIYCGKACNAAAYRQRRACRRREMCPSRYCETCGTDITNRRGDAKFCGNLRCYGVARGTMLAEPLGARMCALPGCDAAFRPYREGQRCCSERHGKMLYNRESRADGRQSEPWNDQRRDRYHKRRALKRGAATGRRVLLADIADRDEWTCRLCGKSVDPDLPWPQPMSKSLDHVVPLTLGGAHDPDNVQLAHLRCNTAKGNRVA